MGEPARVREARLEDAPAIAALVAQLGYPTPPAEMKARLAVLLARPDHVIFVADVSGSVVGLVADDVRLLGRTDLHVVPFTPLGTPPTRFGHLFNAAWVDGQRVTLVLDPNGLIGFLRGLGGTA